MKTFKEHWNITESSITNTQVKESNKGREGKKAIDPASGKEIDGTLYLGDGRWLEGLDDYVITAMRVNAFNGKTEMFDLPRVCIETIKKAHL